MEFSIVAGVLMAVASCFTATQQEIQPEYHVAIVDRFYPGDDFYPDHEERLMQMSLYGYVDLDRDQTREPFYHGDIVSILASHPNIDIHPYTIRFGQHPQREILRQLKNIRKHVFWGVPVHAVLLSWESSTLISAFEKPLRKENVGKYKEIVRKWGHESDVWQLTFATIRVMEDLVEAGVRVFTIAGNGGHGMVNTYSFAEGVTTVGASETELRNFISDNVFVDVRANAAHQPTLIRSEQGLPTGYDFDGDSCEDIPITCVSGYQVDRLDYPDHPWPLLKGSSFSAPVAMKLALLNISGTASMSSQEERRGHCRR